MLWLAHSGDRQYHSDTLQTGLVHTPWEDRQRHWLCFLELGYGYLRRRWATFLRRREGIG